MIDGSLQMKSTRSQNNSELSRLLSVSLENHERNNLCYVEFVEWSAVWWDLLFIHSSELNITVENKSCRLLRKSRSFALNNDIKFKSNPVTEIGICRLGIRESPSDVSFEVDSSRLAVNHAGVHWKMTRRQRTFFNSQSYKIMSSKAEEIQKNWICTCSCVPVMIYCS